MQKIFVIGSNSFSGATFVNFALDQGAEVIGVSRSAEPNPVFLPYQWNENKKFGFYELDLNKDLIKLMELIHDVKPKYVVNFAAQSMVAESWNNPGDWFMTNTVSTIKFHDELRKCNFLKRYIHVSTPEVYGSCSGFVGEECHFNPSTPYAVSRAAADMSLRNFYSAYDFPVVITRAANVYGPGQQLYRIIPRAILFILLGRKLQLHGGGNSTRSFIHIRDVCNATWMIMRDGKNGESYHISTSQVISIRSLVERICEKLNVRFDKHVEIVGDRMGKDSAYHLDCKKIRSELGWRETVSIDQGLDECIEWVSSNLGILQNQKYDYEHRA